MSAFEFVTVFFSVVIGMSVAQLMTAIAELIENRHRVRIYWVQVVWVVTLLILQAQAWWGLWELRAVSEWSIVGFLLIVIYMASIYLITYLALPRPDDGTDLIDLRAHYYNVHRYFFSILLSTSLLAVVLNVAIFKTSLLDPIQFVPYVLGAIAAIAAWTRHPAYHGAVALFFLVAFSVFIAMDGATIH